MEGILNYYYETVYKLCFPFVLRGKEHAHRRYLSLDGAYLPTPSFMYDHVSSILHTVSGNWCLLRSTVTYRDSFSGIFFPVMLDAVELYSWEIGSAADVASS